MILVGIDDTDVIGSKGTNQLAREIVRRLNDDWRCVRIVRHQLLDDPRVPYTSKNGSASIALQPKDGCDLTALTETCRRVIREWYIEGSDPGLAIATNVMTAVVEFGRTCQTKLVTQQQAIRLAERAGTHLEGLGGTNGGVIGALAAVGLAATQDDGRIVQFGGWPDDLHGVQPIKVIRERGVELRDAVSSAEITRGTVDLVKRLRPNLRGGRAVLFVRPHPEPANGADYEAVKLP